MLYIKNDTFSSCVLTYQPRLITGLHQVHKQVTSNTKTDTQTHTPGLFGFILPPPLSNLSDDITPLDWVSLKWSLACMRGGGGWESFFFFPWQTGFLARRITFVRVVVSEMGVGAYKSG